MIEICYWVADDGTKFEEEKECFNYEWRQKYQKIKNNGLKILIEVIQKLTIGILM